MDSLHKYTYDYLLNQALSRVPDTIDKREGSIIYDALAPACYELAGFYLELDAAYENVFIDSCVGEFLDRKVAERGLTRMPATYAERRIDCKDEVGTPMSVAIGTRLATISSTNPINYEVISTYKDEKGNAVDGAFIVRCETAGVVGNSYTGEMLSISNINGLSSCIMSTIIKPAQNEETDEHLRARFLASIKSNSYGGNRAQYIEWLTAIDGVGSCQIYPVWKGGGTVKCSIIDGENNPVSDDFLKSVKEQLDPDPSGTGLGLVPIGHTVTVVTPDQIPVNVIINCSLYSGYEKADVEKPITEALAKEINSVCSNWGVFTSSGYLCIMYLSRIISDIVSVEGVENVSSVTLNGEAKDISFVENKTTQQIPSLGTVTINV